MVYCTAHKSTLILFKWYNNDKICNIYVSRFTSKVKFNSTPSAVEAASVNEGRITSVREREVLFLQVHESAP